MKQYKAYIFDADGTLRRCTVPGQWYPHRASEWELVPGVRERLTEIDWTQADAGIVSNQAGVAKGYLSRDAAWLHLRNTLAQSIGFSPADGAIQLCPHVRADGCACRKPSPQMLWAVTHALGVAPEDALYVGDLDTDQEAARRARCDFAWAWDFFGRSKEEWVELVNGGVRERNTLARRAADARARVVLAMSTMGVEELERLAQAVDDGVPRETIVLGPLGQAGTPRTYCRETEQ